MQTLKFKELTFNAGHYLPGHPNCGCIHGHTFFLRDIEAIYDDFVDFQNIKVMVIALDHKLLVPAGHGKYWNTLAAKELLSLIGCSYNVIEIPYGDPTVENISQFFYDAFKSIKGIQEISFELYEGPNQGVCVIPDGPR